MVGTGLHDGQATRGHTHTPTHSIALRDGAVRVHSIEDPITFDIFVDQGIPRGTRALSSTDEKRMTVASEYCRAIDRKLASTILATVTVRAVRRGWAKRSNSSGLILNRMLHARADEVGRFAHTAIAGKLQPLMDSGPENRTAVAGCNARREEWDSWNNSHSPDAIVPATLAATRYEAAARRLGEPLAARIYTEIRLMAQARGNAENTVAAINKVLGDCEAELITTSNSGGALQAGDPRKTDLSPHPLPGYTAIHLNRMPNCRQILAPLFDKSENKKEKEKREEEKKKRATAMATSTKGEEKESDTTSPPS
ncbi:MAG: hypothetical protein SGPRY_010657 [Prymnesium sp.]